MQRNFNFGDSSPGLVTPELAVRPRQVALLGTVGGAPDDLSAHKGEAPELAGGGGFKAQGDAPGRANCALAGAERKAWATIQAQCALAGFTPHLIEGDDGRPLLVVSRWALTRSFTSPGDADAWLTRFSASRLNGQNDSASRGPHSNVQQMEMPFDQSTSDSLALSRRG